MLKSPHRLYWLTESFVEFGTWDRDTIDEFNQAFREARNPMMVISCKDMSTADKVIEKATFPVVIWITKPSESKTGAKSFYVAYGNEVSLSSRYAHLNLVFSIPPMEKRMN